MELPGLDSLVTRSSAMLDKSSSVAGKAVSAVEGWKSLVDSLIPPTAASPAAPAPEVSATAKAEAAPQSAGLISSGITWSVRIVAGVVAIGLLAYLALRRRK